MFDMLPTASVSQVEHEKEKEKNTRQHQLPDPYPRLWLPATWMTTVDSYLVCTPLTLGSCWCTVPFGARITLHLDALMKIMGEGSAHSEYRVLVMGPGSASAAHIRVYLLEGQAFAALTVAK